MMLYITNVTVFICYMLASGTYVVCLNTLLASYRGLLSHYAYAVSSAVTRHDVRENRAGEDNAVAEAAGDEVIEGRRNRDVRRARRVGEVAIGARALRAICGRITR